MIEKHLAVSVTHKHNPRPNAAKTRAPNRGKYRASTRGGHWHSNLGVVAGTWSLVLKEWKGKEMRVEGMSMVGKP